MNSSKIELLPVIFVVLIVAISCFGFDSKKAADKKTPSKGKGFAVVELFTSEGCSSCPPADELVSKILRENKQDVYILSFHVDYWDRLGWKDNFSQPAFSDRQKQYAHYLSLDGVYTPQIVVNGTDQFVGSNESHLRSSLNNTKPESNLTIEATKTNNESVHLLYKITGNNSALLNVALIQPDATTQVRRGENGGRKLHHVNIVREFKTIETTANTGTLDIEIPAELRELPFKVIAYTQHENNFQITGAAQTAVVVTGKHT
ncbi:MAG: DUF1223 domain-containing protein [Segetibacter sp.]